MKYMIKEPIVDAFHMTENQCLSNRGWPVWLREAWRKPSSISGCFYVDPRSRQRMVTRKRGDRRMVHYGEYIVRDSHGNLDVWSSDSFHDHYVIAREV